MRTFTMQELRTGLGAQERAAERYGPPIEEVARARRWLGLPDDAESTFVAVARELATNIGNDGSPDEWARVGGFFHLAGDDRAARPWLKRVVKERKWYVAPHVLAGSLYLLGDYRRAGKVGADGPASQLAEVAKTGDVSRLPEVREWLVAVAMDVSDGPHQVSGGDPLTTWDWLEESFLLESRLTGAPVPSHLEILERLGVLSDDPRPPVPPPLSPEVGLRVDLPFGAWLEVDRSDWVEVFVPPSFSVVIRQQFELWGAWVPDAPESSGEWIVEPEFPDWRHAASEAARRIGLYVGKREGEAITDLAVLAGGDAGEAVPKPREPAGPSDSVVFPTVNFTAYNIVDIELAADLLLQFREPWDSKGWYGRIAHEALAPMDDVVPGPYVTWQDGARAMVRWLTENQDGRGVAELEQIINDYPSSPS